MGVVARAVVMLVVIMVNDDRAPQHSAICWTRSLLPEGIERA